MVPNPSITLLSVRERSLESRHLSQHNPRICSSIRYEHAIPRLPLREFTRNFGEEEKAVSADNDAIQSMYGQFLTCVE